MIQLKIQQLAMQLSRTANSQCATNQLLVRLQKGVLCVLRNTLGLELSSNFLEKKSVIVLVVKVGFLQIAPTMSHRIMGIVMGVIRGMLLMGLQRSAKFLQKIITVDS